MRRPPQPLPELVGSIMAHYYTDRIELYGIAIDRFLPFNFLCDVQQSGAPERSYGGAHRRGSSATGDYAGPEFRYVHLNQPTRRVIFVWR
jgi:hypothetical protein